MKPNFSVIIISAIVTAVVTSILLKLVGNSMGIPDSWNPALCGGLAAAVSSVLGQKFAKQDAPEESTESSQT